MVDITQKPYFHYNDVIDLLMAPIQTLANVQFHSLIRIFANGERFLISRNKEESISYMENRLFRYGVYEKNHPKNHQNISSGFRMWDYLSYAPPEIFQHRLQKFNMAHGLTVIQQHGNYCDFFGFSTTPGNTQINNFYLDQKELFTQFVQNFYIQMADTLLNLATKIFMLPSSTVFVSNPILSLTPRQLDCSQLLAKGITSKEIARVLNLSPRTVETHIDTLKDKFRAKNRVHLIHSLNKIL